MTGVDVAKSDFGGLLEQLVKARFPVLMISTHEEDRAVAEIVRVLGEKGNLKTPRPVMVWSRTKGLTPVGGTPDPKTADLHVALNRMAMPTSPAVYILMDVHAALGAGTSKADDVVLRMIRDLAHAYRTGSVPATLILVSPVMFLPPELEKVVTIVDFPLPTEGEIRHLLDEMIAANEQAAGIVVDLSADDKDRLVKASVGLTLAEAENALARAMVNDGRLDASDVQVVLEEKRQTIRKSGILDIVPTVETLEDVGGLENLKKWLIKRNGSWLASAAEYGLPAPKGILITGVPGCGKSLTAKAVASEWGLPLLRLDMGRVFAGLVGSSEQNMRSALQVAEAIAPCVLWIDEIEKGFSGLSGSGDSGVSKRVFGTFLTWMQEKSRPVFVIATANNIDQLPPEFLRKGRFDEIFFVDLPTGSERRPIWKTHLARRLESAPAAAGALSLVDADLHDLVSLSDGYSGAEIEQAVIAALFDAYAERRPLALDDVARAVKNMVPLSVTQEEEIAALRAWAATRAVAATASSDFDAQQTTPPDPKSASGGEGVKGLRSPESDAGLDGASPRGGRLVEF